MSDNLLVKLSIEFAAKILGLPEEVLEVPHLNSSSLSEVNYRMAWVQTLLKKYGDLEKSAENVDVVLDAAYTHPAFTGNKLLKWRVL